MAGRANVTISEDEIAQYKADHPDQSFDDERAEDSSPSEALNEEDKIIYALIQKMDTLSIDML